MDSTDLIDLHDTKLRLKAKSLTHLCRSEREMALKWKWGYGVHGAGKVLWDAVEDAYLAGSAEVAPSISMGVLGYFHDPCDFRVSAVCRERFPRVSRAMHWNMLAPGMNRAISNLRRYQPGGRTAQLGVL